MSVAHKYAEPLLMVEVGISTPFGKDARMAPRQWGAVVQGEPADLECWASMLKPPFDPWVEVHGKDTILFARRSLDRRRGGIGASPTSND